MLAFLTQNTTAILLSASMATAFCANLQPTRKRNPWHIAAITLFALAFAAAHIG